MKNKKREALLTNLRDIGTIHNRATIDNTDLIDEEKRMIPFIIVSDDNAGLRYDWWKDEIFEERLDPQGATYDGLNTFFKDHNMRVDSAIGKVQNIRLDDGQLKADVIFGTGEDEENVFRKFREGILTDVSIGYSIQEVITTERKDEPTEVLVTRFDIHELSAVWKGFDSKAKVGRENLGKEETPNEPDLITIDKQRLRRLRLKEIELNIK